MLRTTINSCVTQSYKRKRRKIIKKNFLIFKMSYFILFASLATYFPSLGKYYKELGFSGTQIGVLFGSATLVTMIMQPIWGVICDKKGKCKNIFLLLHIAVIGIALILPFIRNFYLLVIVMSLHFIFQCALSPLLDTMFYKDVHDFGNVRLWGSIGFAVMILFVGKISELIGVSSMFFLYAFFTAISFFIALNIKEIETSAPKIKKSKLESMKELFRKEYVLFLLTAFFIMGAFMAGGSYYSILFIEKSGGMTAFGISYFFIAFSEVPFLKFSHKIIKKYGPEKIIILSGIFLLIRYTLYGLVKDFYLLLYSSVVMGGFIGLILPAIAIFLKEKIKPENRGTAVTIYSSISTGLGAMIFQFTGGIVYDFYNISIVYFFLCFFIIIGIFLSVILAKHNTKVKIAVLKKG